MPLIVALTGGIGSGKSTVADLLAGHGAHVVDADLISHQLTSQGGAALERIVGEFGESALDESGALDRARMRRKIFDDASSKVRLESILHPIIREQLETEIAAAPAASSYVILAVPLLFETMSYRNRAKRILAVDCPVALQVTRVIQRSNLSLTDAQRIIHSQVCRATRLQLADDVITNSGTMAQLTERAAELHYRYLSLASTYSQTTTSGM